MMEYGSKEHTQFAYLKCKELCGDDTKTIMDFIDFLKSEGKLIHLKDMTGLSLFETKLIEEKLKE